jgi:hypothetical protein
MILFLLFFLMTPEVQQVPYKPENEFSVRVDMKFKSRPIDGTPKIDFTETQKEYDRRTSSSQLPFLTLFITVTEASQGETRMRIMRDGKQTASSKKFDLGKEFPLEVGFTDDAKDGVSGYEHVIFFLKPDKKESNKIVIRIERNGDYYINEQRLGRL